MKTPPRGLFRVLAAAMLSASLTTGCIYHGRLWVKPTPSVPVESPTAAPTAKATHRPTPLPTGRLVAPAFALRGNATWYRYVPGGAAAGPALRKALGKHWRGKVVTVWRGNAHVRVKLSDWCLCSHGNRVIDLDSRAFDVLGSLGEGVIPVRVEW
jgi:hypothetical protein